MRKTKHNTILLLTIFILLLVFLTFVGVMIYNKVNETIYKEFKLSEYSSIINNYPSDEQIGVISSILTAKENVRELFGKIYGEDVLNDYKYTIVGYDSESDTWLVCCSLISPFKRKYGRTAARSPCAIVQSNGRVLAIWA